MIVRCYDLRDILLPTFTCPLLPPVFLQVMAAALGELPHMYDVPSPFAPSMLLSCSKSLRKRRRRSCVNVDGTVDRRTLRKIRRATEEEELALYSWAGVNSGTVGLGAKTKRRRDRTNSPFVIWDELSGDYRMLKAQESWWALLYLGKHSNKPAFYRTFNLRFGCSWEMYMHILKHAIRDHAFPTRGKAQMELAGRMCVHLWNY